jgi:proline iminopeptidase
MLNDGAIGSVMTERVAQAWSAYDDAQSAAGGVAASGARFDASRLPKGEDALLSWRVHAAYAVRGWGALDGHAVGVDAVGAVPGTLSVVWGEADSTCDPAAARALVQRVPGALGRPVAGAGHRMSEPSLASALRDAAREWVLTLSP